MRLCIPSWNTKTKHFEKKKKRIDHMRTVNVQTTFSMFVKFATSFYEHKGEGINSIHKQKHPRLPESIIPCLLPRKIPWSLSNRTHLRRSVCVHIVKAVSLPSQVWNNATKLNQSSSKYHASLMEGKPDKLNGFVIFKGPLTNWRSFIFRAG